MTTDDKASDTKKRKKKPAIALRVIRPMVAGIDIGSKEHWVCGPERPDGLANVRVFGTTTAQLNELADWLLEQKVESVAMESTYVYWIPLYELLESRGIEVVLVNAHQLHNVPGRKTDFSDCQWLQLLHGCGLLRGSFRPTETITRIRTLQRQRTSLVTDRTRYLQWMQKALDQMNVQVHRAVADLTGSTGMAIVRDIVAGKRDPAQLAAHRDRRCRKSVDQIAQYLTGNWREEHLFNLAEALRLYDAVEHSIASYDERLLKELEALTPPERKTESVPPHPNRGKEKAIKARGDQQIRTALWRLSGADLFRIDGISAGTAQTILAEVGPNLCAFPSEDHFVSWLRLCPRTAISGGKPLKKRRNGLGANRVAAALRMAALTLHRSKTALGAAFRRLARRESGAVAVFATARRLAQLVYRMLRYGHDYVDIGEQAYEKRFQALRVAALTQTAKSLGYDLIQTAQSQTATG